MNLWARENFIQTDKIDHQTENYLNFGCFLLKTILIFDDLNSNLIRQ